MRLLARASAALAAVALTSTFLAVSATGPAAADTSAISSPVSGSTVAFGYTGPFTIDMTGSPAGPYLSAIHCVDDGQGEQDVVLDDIIWDGSTDPVRTATSPTELLTSSRCTWSVSGLSEPYWTAGTSDFSVAPPAIPVIVTPAEGALVNYGYAGPFTVDMSRAPAGTYRPGVQCANGRIDYDRGWPDFTWDGTTTPVRSFTLPDGLPTHPDCFFAVTKTPWEQETGAIEGVSHFAVDAPAVTVTRLSQSPATFYPLVRDGYRDRTTTTFRLSRAASVTAVVRNSRNRVVRSQQVGSGQLAAGTRTWSWDGRDRNWARVPVGTYRITLTGKDSAGHKTSASITTKVATARVSRTASKRVTGSSGARSAGRYCSASRWNSEMELDCFGATYAQARYRFAVPASTYKTSFRVAGATSGDDLCCTGRITKFSRRSSARVFDVYAKVTGYRAYTVRSVTATWTYKKQI